jgi:lactoylglutathione lyase
VIEGLNELEVITLFVDDVAASKAFYAEVLGLGILFEDENSAVVRMSNLILNLLESAEAPTLVEPAPVGSARRGAQLLLTINVPDVDAVVVQLEEHGIKLLNGPIDRPWGRRTAAFADPSGFVWEVAQNLPAAS